MGSPLALLSWTCSGSFSPGPLSTSAWDEATRGRLHILQSGSILKSSPDPVGVRRHVLRRTTERPGAPRHPLSCFSSFWVSLSLSSSGQPGAAFEPEIPVPSTDLGTGFNVPHSPESPQPAFKDILNHEPQMLGCKRRVVEEGEHVRRTWNYAPSVFFLLLQYLLAQECDHRGSSLGPEMEPACIPEHSVGGEGYLGCFLC